MSGAFPHLFSKFELRGHPIRNRMFISGHMTMMVTDGAPDAQQAAYYKERAKGGIGLIVTEAAAVHSSGVRSGNVIDASRDDCISGYENLVSACSDFSVPLIGQLFHPGRETGRAGDGSRSVSLGPSSVPSERRKTIPRQIPISMISELVRSYGNAARRLEKAGLIGTEILASMGYLISSFLNPRTNLRNDEFGGTTDKRLRIVSDIISDIRSKTGSDHVLGLRLSMDEFSYDGLKTEEAIEICERLAELGGLDYISVIGGSSTDAGGAIHIVPPMSVEPGYLASLSAQLKNKMDIPVFVTGRINQPHIADKILENGAADMCGMTRANICDPEISNKSMIGNVDAIRACIGCNQACIGHEMLGFPISCIQRPETGREMHYASNGKAEKVRRIYVAGAGPAGLKAAIVAYNRGHDVTLFETKSTIGGQARLAQTLPDRQEFGGLITNLAFELEQTNVACRFGEKLTADIVHCESPHVVLLATGSQPYLPEIELEEGTHLMQAAQVLDGAEKPGQRVLIADFPGDWTGIGTAEMLAKNGHEVTFATTCIVPGEALQPYIRDEWNAKLQKLGITIITYARLFGADTNTAYLQHVVSGAPILVEGIDTIVLAQGWCDKSG